MHIIFQDEDRGQVEKLTSGGIRTHDIHVQTAGLYPTGHRRPENSGIPREFICGLG